LCMHSTLSARTILSKSCNGRCWMGGAQTNTLKKKNQGGP
jgi:hypothetical protein